MRYGCYLDDIVKTKFNVTCKIYFFSFVSSPPPSSLLHEEKCLWKKKVEKKKKKVASWSISPLKNSPLKTQFFAASLEIASRDSYISKGDVHGRSSVMTCINKKSLLVANIPANSKDYITKKRNEYISSIIRRDPITQTSNWSIAEADQFRQPYLQDILKKHLF